jgi:hypothetical protein
MKKTGKRIARGLGKLIRCGSFQKGCERDMTERIDPGQIKTELTHIFGEDHVYVETLAGAAGDRAMFALIFNAIEKQPADQDDARKLATALAGRIATGIMGFSGGHLTDKTIYSTARDARISDGNWHPVVQLHMPTDKNEASAIIEALTADAAALRKIAESPGRPVDLRADENPSVAWDRVIRQNLV